MYFFIIIIISVIIYSQNTHFLSVMSGLFIAKKIIFYETYIWNVKN